MVALVFHGGHYKTGTTSVQSVLRAQEEALRAAGVLYPANPEGSQFGRLQHAQLLTWCADGKFDKVAENLAQIVKDAEAAGCSKVLLSSELATSFYMYPDKFKEWTGLVERHFDDVRYVFAARNVLRYTVSMYRELIKSGRAGFHYDIVRPILVDRLVEQQKSIAFFRGWDAARVTVLDFAALSADRLVYQMIKTLTGYEIPEESEARLNTSEKKAQNMAALLLNDIYALAGAHLGLYPMSADIRALVGSAVKKGKLKRAFHEEFAARLEEAYIEVTERFARRALDETRDTVEQSRAALPADVVDYLFKGLPAAS